MGDVINIAKLKKVNSLASTLNKHGLAANRMDAANLAREINGKQETDYLVDQILVRTSASAA